MNKTEQANSFLNIIRSIIKEEQDKRDRVEICQIDSVNEDGTVNIKMLSDFETVRIIPNISNQSIYSFRSGDLAIIYMIQNQLSNAFIIAKCGPTNESLRISSSDGDITGGGTVIQNITYQSGGTNGVISVNGKTGEVTITAQDLGAITEIPDVTQIQSTDISSLVYDTINGANFEINNSIIFSDGTKNNPLLKFNLPIIGINGISIDKANGKNVLEISGKDLQDLINSISLTSGTNNGTLKLTVGTTIVDNIKVTGFDKKQDQLSESQLNAVNSGITLEKVTTYDEYQSQINSKYTKPDGGIPKSDLSSAVQSSLGKADSALQTHQKITTGGANGTIAVDGTDVAVKGLKALAYKDSLTKSDVGLGNVDNTSDANKPVSTATQTALDGKVNTTTTVNGHALSSNVTITQSDVGLGNVVNAGQDPTPTSDSINYVTSGGVKSYVDNGLNKKADLLVNESTVTTVQSGRLYEFTDIHNPFSLSINMDTFKTSNDVSQIYFTAAANFDVVLNVSSGVRIIGDGVNASAKKISCVQGNSYYFTFGYTKKGVSIVSNIDANWSEIATT